MCYSDPASTTNSRYVKPDVLLLILPDGVTSTLFFGDAFTFGTVPDAVLFATPRGLLDDLGIVGMGSASGIRVGGVASGGSIAAGGGGTTGAGGEIAGTASSFGSTGMGTGSQGPNLQCSEMFTSLVQLIHMRLTELSIVCLYDVSFQCQHFLDPPH